MDANKEFIKSTHFDDETSEIRNIAVKRKIDFGRRVQPPSLILIIFIGVGPEEEKLELQIPLGVSEIPEVDGDVMGAIGTLCAADEAVFKKVKDFIGNELAILLKELGQKITKFDEAIN